MAYRPSHGRRDRFLWALLAFLIALLVLLSFPTRIAGGKSGGGGSSASYAPSEAQHTGKPEPDHEKETERVLAAISWCESRDRHYDYDGTVLRNYEGSSALGRYQIMESVWAETAQELGLDIHTPEGNKAMAEYILKEAQGIGAWSASADCLAEFGIFINPNA